MKPILNHKQFKTHLRWANIQPLTLTLAHFLKAINAVINAKINAKIKKWCLP